MSARDFTVIRYGTDTSGRPIYMTRFMQAVWEAILAHPDVAPFAHKLIIVQGAFMARVAGGGADASAGYHDEGGCLDVRTWNLTLAELTTFIRVARSFGFAFWRRDESQTHGGMDPHAHGVLGSDFPLSPGAASQWREYLAGGDGITGDRPDYEKRPVPLVTAPNLEDEVSWSEDIPRWYPGDENADDTLSAARQLQQARGYAQESYKAARRAEKAVAALAAALGPKVEAAVKEALAESVVDVDVTVNGKAV